MELDRHIEILLLDNDCVIVPGLGGFIAYHTDARYDAESGSFVPPTRTAGFNPKLSMNDNLLAQSYVEAYDISYPEAVKRIAVEADKLKSELEKSGFYEINGVGTLKVSSGSNYEFTPFEAGLLTPEYYGLGCFEMDCLESVKSSDIAVDEEKKEKRGKVVEIKLSTIRNVVAAAVAIFAFFLISTPLGNNDTNMASIAGIQNGVLYKMMPEESVSETEQIKEESVKAPVSENEEVADNEARDEEVKATEKVAETMPAKEEKQSVKESDDKFCIVLASALSKQNAENFVIKLKKEGLTDVYTIEGSNGMKVVCGRYTDEQQARKYLESMRSEHNFSDAWIYKASKK